MKLDHLTIIAPTLEAGATHVRSCLGIDMTAGGSHPEMGTHNLLLRLGDDRFLEVIAVDPQERRPVQRRWFGLDDQAAVRSAWNDGSRLRAWVARTDDLNGILARHGSLLGSKTRVSRGDRQWDFAVLADGALPADGVAPSVIDWGPRGQPAAAMPDLGARLLAFVIEHPDPAKVSRLYEKLRVVDPPLVREGARLRYTATISTPAGVRELS